MNSEEVVLKLPLLADFELPAVDALDHLFARHQVEKHAAAQARFALVEACLNAIEHSRPAAGGMEVRLSFDAGEVCMSVSNPGLPFAGKSRSGVHRGHGMKIIRSMMDSVVYDHDDHGTRVVMKKRVFVHEQPGHGQASANG